MTNKDGDHVIFVKALGVEKIIIAEDRKEIIIYYTDSIDSLSHFAIKYRMVEKK